MRKTLIIQEYSHTQMLSQTYLQNITLTVNMIKATENMKQWQRRLSIDTVKYNAR